MKLVLVLLVFSVAQASPLHERYRRRAARQKENHEVRSIISAIVDAILDGDRKRRSEVVDFDDEIPRDRSQGKTTSENLKENEAQNIKTFRKREQKREAGDNSLPLANVIATSDVNSKNDQKEISKKDVIQHAGEKKPAKKDVLFHSSTSPNEYTLNNYTTVKKSSSEKDGEGVYPSGFQNNSPKVKSGEISGLNNFLYKMVNGEQKPISDQNDARKSDVPQSNSNIKHKESNVKKSQLNSKSKPSNVEKANSKSKVAQNISTQSGPAHEKFVAETYTDFLQLTESPNSAHKHSSVEHLDDDAEMDDDLIKNIRSKTKEFQESKDLDKEDALSGSERNEERMEDTKEDDSMKSDDQSKNDSENDGEVIDNKGKMSRDASEMDSEDDATFEKNSNKQPIIQTKPETTDDIPSHVEDSEMDSDDSITTSTKKFDKQSKETSQSETETMDGTNGENHSEMSDSSAGEDQAEEKTDDGSESENDSMESGKDLEEDKVGSPQDPETAQENLEEETLGSSEDFKTTGENMKDHSLDPVEDSTGSQENELGSTEEPTESTSGLKGNSGETKKETSKIDHSDSEINTDSGNKVESIEDDNPGNKAQNSDSLLSEENLDRKTGDKTKDLNKESTNTSSDSKDGLLSKEEDGPETNSNTGSTSSSPEESSALKTDGKNNVKGFGSSDSKTADNSETTSEDSSTTESKVGVEPDSSLQDNGKTYAQNSNSDTNSDTDSSSEDPEQKNEAGAFNNLESISKDSNHNNTTPSTADEKEIATEENSSEENEVKGKEVSNDEVESKEPTSKEAISNEDSDNNISSKEVNSDNGSEESKDTRENSLGIGSVFSDSENTTPSKDNTDNEVVIEATSKTGQTTVSPTINNEKNTGKKIGNEKKVTHEEDKEVKPKESGKIIETSYRVNNDDTSKDDDFRDQENDVWTNDVHNDPVLNEDDIPSLVGNEENAETLNQGLQAQPDDSQYVNNLHIGGNDLYATQNSELKNFEVGKMQATPVSNDYNWLTTVPTNTQHFQTIQDHMQDYQSADWNEKVKTYLHQGQNQQTTEPPEFEKRTQIPTATMESSEYIRPGIKQSSQNKKSKQFTMALTDNDVYGYAGRIGPFLQKRYFVPHAVDARREETKKDDVLEGLVTGVNEPWIKNFLTKTLEMAVNGDKGVLTSEQDGREAVEDSPPIRRNEVNQVASSRQMSKENEGKQDDEMPADATNNKDGANEDGETNNESRDEFDRNSEEIDSFLKEDNKDSNETDRENSQQNKQREMTASTREKFEDQTEQQDGANMEEVPKGTPLSEVLKAIPKQSQSPVADIATIPSHGGGPLKSVIRITARVPTQPEQSGIPTLSQIQPPQLATSQLAQSTPQLPPSITPQQPDIPTYPPSSDMVHIFPESENNLPTPLSTSESQTTNIRPPTPVGPTSDLTSSNQAAPAAVGPIIKVITALGRNAKGFSNDKKLYTSRENTKIQSEINDALNNSIQNIGISSSNNVLENTIKEAQLIRVLKDAIPVDQRRPVGTEDDLKQGLDDLKDYAIALTEAAGLSQAQRDEVAQKLARDLLNEMRVMGGRKQDLLKELMSFVTATEVSTFKERLNEIKSRIIQLYSKNPENIVEIRSTAIKLLDELFEQLSLPKEQIKETEKRVGDSKLLKSLIQEGEKRVLRSKLKKALIDLVADKLL